MNVGVLEVADLHGSTLEFEVRTTVGFKMRIAIGLFLVRMACRVMRCGVDIKKSTEAT